MDKGPLCGKEEGPTRLVPTNAATTFSRGIFGAAMTFNALILPRNGDNINGTMDGVNGTHVRYEFRRRPLVERPCDTIPMTIAPVMQHALVRNEGTTNAPRIFQTLRLLPRGFLLRFYANAYGRQ